MFKIDLHSARLKQQMHRLLGNRVQLTWSRGCELDPVIGEPEWIEQAILEMTVRARAAMPYGGRLTIETCNLDLDEFSAAAEALNAGRYVMFEMTCLRDRPGFAGEPVPLPFSICIEQDGFVATELTQSVGTLVAVGGNICEYNEPGRGLTLRAFFPSAATVIYSDEEDVTVSEAESRSAILLVEDEGYVREVTCEILESAGYKVVVARTAREAIAIFEKQGPFMLLLTDVIMPGMNGRELAQKLTSIQPDLKTIYMSGYTDNPVLRQDIQSAKSTYIQKPFTLNSLTDKVRSVLEGQVA